MSSAPVRFGLSNSRASGSFVMPVMREAGPSLKLSDYSAPMIDSSAAIARRTSPWTLRQKIARAIWMISRGIFFRLSFHNWYAWRRFVLRCFGARIGRDVRIRPSVWVEIPWHLSIGDDSIIGDGAILYSLGQITVGRYTTISQYAHLCAGTHDHTSRSFDLIKGPITIGDNAWIAAEAFVGPGVTVGARSVVAARAVVVRDVPSDEVVAGNPAVFVKPRVIAA